jgi:hypothetical protein
VPCRFCLRRASSATSPRHNSPSASLLASHSFAAMRSRARNCASPCSSSSQRPSAGQVAISDSWTSSTVAPSLSPPVSRNKSRASARCWTTCSTAPASEASPRSSPMLTTARVRSGVTRRRSTARHSRREAGDSPASTASACVDSAPATPPSSSLLSLVRSRRSRSRASHSLEAVNCRRGKGLRVRSSAASMPSTMSSLSKRCSAASIGRVNASRSPSRPNGGRSERPRVTSVMSFLSSAVRSRKSERMASTTRSGEEASSAAPVRQAMNDARSSSAAPSV